MIEGAAKDRQSVTADWVPVQPLIDGVRVREVRNVPKETGVLVEVFRQEWALDDGVVDQVFQVTLFPGAISAWHAHELTTDRLFVNQGQMKLVLYDARPDSPTHAVVNELRFGSLRPALVVVPPGVWHGIQNLSNEVSSVLNMVDRAYRYEDPDHWRLPASSPQIPYAFRA